MYRNSYIVRKVLNHLNICLHIKTERVLYKLRMMRNEQNQKEDDVVYGLPCCSASWN
jgi:hypothetical protein